MVIAVKSLTASIKLESGSTVHYHEKHFFRLGDPVEILYDFTKNCIRDIRPHDGKSEELEVDVEEPAITDAPGEDDDLDESVPGSGVLRPSGGGCEFWDLDSGILVLSAWFTEGDHFGYP